MTGERILVVDDEPHIVRLCTRILTQEGYAVRGVSSGREAIARLERETFDLLVVDVVMPDLSGLAVFRRGRELDPDLTAVVITGFVTMDSAVEAMHAGAREFVLKPFEFRELVQAVDRALAHRQKEQERLRLRARLPILEIAQALAVEGDVDYLASQLLERVVRELAADRAALLLLDKEADELYVAEAIGLPAEVASVRIPASQDMASRILQEEKPLVLAGAAGPKTPWRALMDGAACSTIVLAALRTVKRTIGALSLCRPTDSTPFTPSELDLLYIIAGQIATALENARLYEEVQRELSERRRMEEAYRTVVEHSLQGIAVIQDHHFVFVNQACAEILGYTAAELLALSPEEMVAMVLPEDRESLVRRYQDRLAGEPLPPRHQFRVVRKDGSVRWLETFSSLVDFQGRPAVQAALMDTTERRRAEEQVCIQRDLGLALSAARGLEETLRLCLEAAIQTSRMGCGGVYLVEETSGDLVLAAHVGLSPCFVKSTSCYSADSEHVRLIMKGQPIYTHHQELAVPLDETRQWEGPRALAIIPVRHQGRVIACLNLASHTLDEVPAFARNALEAIAAQIGGAIGRSQVEEALRQSEERYRIVSELTSDFAYAFGIGPEGNLVPEWMTEAFSRITGFSPAEVETNGGWTGLVHPEDRPFALQGLQSVLSGRSDGAELRIVTKGGQTRWLNVRSHPVWDKARSRVVRVYGAAQDITARRQAEGQIRVLSSVVTQNPNSIAILDPAGTVEQVNRAFLELNELSPEQVLGKNWRSFLSQHSSLREYLPEIREVVLHRGMTWKREVTDRTKSGDVIWREATLSPIKDAAGEMTHSVYSSVDITERKRVEGELRRCNTELAALNVIATTISQSLDLEHILHTALEETLQVVQADGGWVQLLDEDTGELFLVVHQGLDQAMAEVVARIPSGQGLTGRVLQEGQPVVVNGVSGDPLLDTEAHQEAGLEVFVGVPIKSKDNVLGVLAAFRCRPTELAYQDVQLLTLIGHQIAVAVENVRLFEQLFSAHGRLWQLAQQMVSVREEERRPVSRELHDEAGQALTALKMDLQLILSDLTTIRTGVLDRLSRED